MERTLVLIKPDGVQRGLSGEVIARLERRGLRMVAAKFLQVEQELAERHYAVHKSAPFYDGLIEYITAGPVVVRVNTHAASGPRIMIGGSCITARTRTRAAQSPAAGTPTITIPIAASTDWITATPITPSITPRMVAVARA